MSADEPETAAQPRRPVVDDLSAALHAKILAGEIPIGTWLRQRSLAKEYGVSRTPVREALRALHAGGIVVLEPNRGALVKGPTPLEVREAYVVRAELEGLGAALAAAHADAAALQRLREAEELFAASVGDVLAAQALAPTRGSLVPAEGITWTRANDQFHEAILDASGNRRLKDTIEQLHRSFPRNLSWSALADEPSLVEDNVNEHRRVRAAIEDRDPEAARRWMADHVRRAGDMVATWWARASQTEEDRT